MQPLQAIPNWLAGDGRYMDLMHCMGHDTFWIAATVILDVSVAAGYALIAMHWWKNSRLLPDVPAKRALASMRNIFLFCGICGYAFIPIKMVWPAWRLYDLFMVALVWFTWRYAWNARDLRVVYRELGRSSQLEKDLERSREESRRTTSFLNAVSHDLRTPLNSLMLQLSIAEICASKQDFEQVKQTLTEMKTSAMATARMLDGLLDFARAEFESSGECGHKGSGSPQPESFQLVELLRGAVSSQEPAARQKGISIKLSCPEQLPIRTNRNRLERALGNLLSNAIKFTPHGSIRIEADVSGSARRDVEIHIIDTGCGIPRELQTRIFDEFYQVGNAERSRDKGYGLGLPIARRLVRGIGGEITCESEPGRGSRFSILLPEAAGDTTAVLVGGDSFDADSTLRTSDRQKV